MAMDDILRLAKGVVIEGEIARPARVDNLVPYGPWTKATVHQSSLFVRASEGLYYGTVSYSIGREKSVRQASFNALWVEGWTSVEFMNDCISAQSRCRGKCGGFVQEGVYVHSERCTQRSSKKTPVEAGWTMEKLVLWVAKRAASRDPAIVCNHLSVEGLRDKDVPSGAFPTVVRYRHMNSASRLSRVRTILEKP